jgi:hypothetical protein
MKMKKINWVYEMTDEREREMADERLERNKISSRPRLGRQDLEAYTIRGTTKVGRGFYRLYEQHFFFFFSFGVFKKTFFFFFF